MIKNKESLYLKYWDMYNLYGWAMSQKLPLGGFKQFENKSDFMENYNKDNDKLKAHRQISKKRCLEKYCSCDKTCPFSAL